MCNQQGHSACCKPPPTLAQHGLLPDQPLLHPYLEGISSILDYCPVEGMQEKTAKAALVGEFVNLDEFLANISILSDKVHDVQSYMDTTGAIVYKPKLAKRRVTCFLTWLEAFTAYQQLMVAIHGYDLYMSMANYIMKILDYERKYQWNAVYTLDIRHRADLSRKSVEFTNIDPRLPSSIFDSTVIKTSAPRYSVCKSFLHTIAECPFSAVMGHQTCTTQRGTGTLNQTKAIVVNQWKVKYAITLIT